MSVPIVFRHAHVVVEVVAGALFGLGGLYRRSEAPVPRTAAPLAVATEKVAHAPIGRLPSEANLETDVVEIGSGAPPQAPRWTFGGQ